MDETTPVQVIDPSQQLARGRQGEQCCWSHAREFNSMYVIVHTHAFPPFWHTHRGEDKEQVRLEMNMYSNKLMWMTTSTCLEINIEIMKQHVVGPVAPKTTMHMLLDELDGGAISVYPNATEARVRFSKMSPLSAQMNKFGICSPPSIITRISRVGLTKVVRVLVISCMACSSHFVSHGYMWILYVMSFQV